jgi:serine/threonine protein phosphatase 1
MIYAVGDIHGELDLLEQLLEEIRVDARGYGSEEHKIVFVGDYIDRGASSAAVLDRVKGGVDGFETVCLRGNHEQAMLEVCRNHDISVAKTWLTKMIGGCETLKSYDVDPLDIKPALKSEQKLADILVSIPEDHLRFIEDMPLTHIDGKYLFVHAGIRPGIALEAQQEDDLLWIRRDFTTSRIDHGYIVVHGHSWKKRPQNRKNRIGIDTGAFATGRLTAVALNGASKPRFIQVRH